MRPYFWRSYILFNTRYKQYKIIREKKDQIGTGMARNNWKECKTKLRSKTCPSLLKFYTCIRKNIYLC